MSFTRPYFASFPAQKTITVKYLLQWLQQSDSLSDIYSDMLFGIVSGILPDIYSDIWPDRFCDMYSGHAMWHLYPCVHSAEKLCPLNRLQTQPYTTKWRLNLNQPPLLQNGLVVLWWIKSQCRSLQNDFAYPFCSENGLQWKIMILY